MANVFVTALSKRIVSDEVGKKNAYFSTSCGGTNKDNMQHLSYQLKIVRVSVECTTT